MEEKIVREDIEKLLKEIKSRIEPEDESPSLIEKYPIPIMLAAFGAGVILSRVDKNLFEDGDSEKSCPAVKGLLKIGLPLLIKKIIK